MTYDTAKLSVIYAECRYAECLSADCRGTTQRGVNTIKLLHVHFPFVLVLFLNVCSML
jgi:hypothetical protein